MRINIGLVTAYATCFLAMATVLAAIVGVNQNFTQTAGAVLGRFFAY